MKKKIFTLLTVAAIGVGIVTGCGGNSGKTVSPEKSAVETITAKDKSLPPLDAELQQLYAGAYQIYNQIGFGDFDYDTETTIKKGDYEYFRMTDSRFQTYDEFRTYLLQYFTEQFVEENILGSDNIMFTEGEDGSLYFIGGARGSNIYYAGHTFAIDKENEEEIDFKATAYYTNSDTPYDGDYFYEAPADSENYTTENYLFVLKKGKFGWRFDTFHLFF